MFLFYAQFKKFWYLPSVAEEVLWPLLPVVRAVRISLRESYFFDGYAPKAARPYASAAKRAFATFSGVTSNGML